MWGAWKLAGLTSANPAVLAGVGTELRATLSDDDGLLSYPSWQWWRAESAEGPFTKIGGATAAEYTPTAADSRKVLRATVAYSDPQGPNKMAAGTTLRVDALRFVSNHRHAIAGSQQAMFLQSFDTGTSLGSFVPGDVAVHLVKADGEATVRDPVVKLLSDETDNGIVDPAKVIATLSRGDDPGDTGTYWFSPRSDVVLQPEITYFVEVSSTHASGRVNASTVAGTESDGPVLPGWHFGELRTRDSVSDPWGAPATGALRLEVRGFAQLAGGSAPQFFGGNTTALSLAEDATATTRFGSVSAIDYDGDTNLTYTVVATGADAAALADLAAFNRDFELDPASAQVSVRAGAQLDDETRSTYVVKVNVTDGEDANGDIEATPVVDDTSTLTITVTNVDDRGRVSVAGVPQQGITLTASLDDPDGAVTGETWQWSRSGSRDGRFVDIADATAATYAPTAEDEGQYLRVTVRYADGAGDGKSALATTQSWVPAEFVANVDQTSATAVATSASRTAFAQAFTTGSVGHRLDRCRHPHRRRLCVLDRGRVQPPDRGLARRRSHAHRHGPRRRRDGMPRPRRAHRGAHGPFRRRQPGRIQPAVATAIAAPSVGSAGDWPDNPRTTRWPRPSSASTKAN